MRPENLSDVFQIGDHFHVVSNIADEHIEFCCEGISNVVGYEAREFTRHQLIKNIHPEDLAVFLKQEDKIIELYNRQSTAQTSNFKACYDFRLRTKLGAYKRLMRQIVHFGCDDAGNPVRCLCVFTDITHLKRDTSIQLSVLSSHGESSGVEVNIKTQTKPDNPFSERELQVLKLLSAGESINGIAGILNLSVNTIKNHRYNMLLKAGVQSSPGLLGKAIKNAWIN